MASPDVLAISLSRTVSVALRDRERARTGLTRRMKPHRFEKAPLLAVVSNRHGFGNSLGRCRVSRRCNSIENDAVINASQMTPRSCERCLIQRTENCKRNILTTKLQLLVPPVPSGFKISLPNF